MLTEIQLVQQKQFLFSCVLDLLFSQISMHLNLQVIMVFLLLYPTSHCGISTKPTRDLTGPCM